MCLNPSNSSVMMVGGWLYPLSAVWLVAVTGGQDVGVTMCCPPGRLLKIVRNNGRRWIVKRRDGWMDRGDEYIPKCVRKRGAPKDTLEGSTITVVDEEYSGLTEMSAAGEKSAVVKKTGVKMPSCHLGRKFQMVKLKGSGE